MLSDFLSPFLERDEEFSKNVGGVETADGGSSSLQQRVLGFQRRHSLCPVTLPNSKFNAGPWEEEEDDEGPEAWGLGAEAGRWAREGRLPRSALGHIPFRVDRSVSMIEGGLTAGEDRAAAATGGAAAPPRPPPGLGLSSASLRCSSSSLLSLSSSSSSLSPPASTRYKTELCRTYEESGVCKYGSKCQFAHGEEEVRGLHRHPKYKTEPCRTFHTVGFCPYGARCHFIHNADEMQDDCTSCPAPPQRPRLLRPPLLRHSFSFAGFSSSSSSSSSSTAAAAPQTLASSFQPAPSALLFSRASSVSPPPSSTSSFGSPELLSPLFPEPGPRKHSMPFSSSATTPDPAGDTALRFYALSDAVAKRRASSSSSSASSFTTQSAGHLPSAPRLPGLQRCSSADSLSEEGYTSSCSLSSGGSESPCFEGRRLPIFSRLSVTDE